MASFKKVENGWKVFFKKKNFRKSKTFRTKAEGVAWIAQLEVDLQNGQKGQIPNKTFGELLERYAAEVSVKKRGWKWESIRIKAFLKEPISRIYLKDLKSSDFATWRDARLKSVSESTVNRELNLLSSCCSIAIREWGWLLENPLKKINRPANPPPRDRLISKEEIEKILYRAGYLEHEMCKTTTSRVGAAFLFAIETAMRAGEIEKLKWEDVDLKEQVATLHETKNGYKRDVPLSTEAIRIINQMPKNSEYIFNLQPGIRDALFRKIKKECLITDLKFHDTRHEAITRLSKKLNIYELARMVGHRNLQMLMVYYNETAGNIAKKLG